MPLLLVITTKQVFIELLRYLSLLLSYNIHLIRFIYTRNIFVVEGLGIGFIYLMRSLINNITLNTLNSINAELLEAGID